MNPIGTKPPPRGPVTPLPVTAPEPLSPWRTRVCYPVDSESYFALLKTVEASGGRVVAIAQPTKKEAAEHRALWVVTVTEPRT
jgi:hypothetical protein